LNWTWLTSRGLLLNPRTLWLLMIIYVPGTLYGYYWYKDQLEETWTNHSNWLIPFVPDSPTASLFFALAVLWLWLSPKPSKRKWVNGIRGIIETLGVVTSVKYGVWATAIIFAGQAQGDILQWDSWMLIIGHSAMAVCALVYARFFSYGGLALLVAAAWTFLNDTIDYTYDVFPYLPRELYDDLFYVGLFTFILTALSVLAAAIAKFVYGQAESDKSF
jgi:uncharacterized membrane protein YpjA